MICPPDHKHEQTTNCWTNHKCKCEPCRENYRERRKAWTPRPQHTRRVPADLARAHIIRAIEKGASTNAIADRTGLPDSTIFRVYKGQRKTLRQDTHKKILSFKGAPRNTVDAWRVRRRLEALAAIGYSSMSISNASNASHSALRDIHAHAWPTVRTNVANAVFEFYREHHMKPVEPGSASVTRTLNWARREGFHPPAAWDDIDDPDEQPAGARGGRVCRDCRDVMEVAA